jgi:hypothetical protein
MTFETGSTLGAHVQAATANAANRAQNNPLGTRPPLLRRRRPRPLRQGSPGSKIFVSFRIVTV